jgi:alpha-glucosidase
MNIPMGLSMSLCGQPMNGHDIGGFYGYPTSDSKPSAELFTRWMQCGVFSPFCRAHHDGWGNNASRPFVEPWQFGTTTENTCRDFINLRYRLMPYLYSSFYESSANGMPVMRSLAIANPFDEAVYRSDYQQEYMFGPSILVTPVRSTERLAKVYLPQGNWYDLYTDQAYNGSREILTEAPIEKIPLFIKAGSILPMQKLTETTAENPGDTLFIHVYAGNQPNSYTYYEDDGKTYGYEKGSYYQRTILFDPTQSVIRIEKKEGNMASQFRTITLFLHGFKPDALQKISVNGTGQNVQDGQVSFFTSRFIFADYGPKDLKKVKSVSFSNSDETIEIAY